MQDYLWVGIGGLVGANARFMLGTWINARVDGVFPWHTLLINVSGSFLIGFLMILLTERLEVDPAWRLLLVVGFLGGYTTFSSYSFEAIALIRAGDWTPAIGYMLGSNVLSLGATLLGIVLAGGFMR
jgi:CrcB protein